MFCVQSSEILRPAMLSVRSSFLHCSRTSFHSSLTLIQSLPLDADARASHHPDLYFVDCRHSVHGRGGSASSGMAVERGSWSVARLSGLQGRHRAFSSPWNSVHRSIKRKNVMRNTCIAFRGKVKIRVLNSASWKRTSIVYLRIWSTELSPCKSITAQGCSADYNISINLSWTYSSCLSTFETRYQHRPPPALGPRASSS